MSIYVDIKKSMGTFSLSAKFEAENEIMGLLGSSGCGKSMTLKCIAGIMTPDKGRIVLNDRVLFDSDKSINLMPQERKTGYLFQNYALFPHMTVAENIAVGIHGSKEMKQELVREKINAFYLSGLEARYPAQISGGQQQRVALARIFASEPDIIMLDEPFSALDSHLKWQIELETVKALEKYTGTILFVSHNRDEVYRLCKRIAVIEHGHMESIHDKSEMFAAPKTLAASKLTGCKNHSRAKKIGEHELYAIDWDCSLKSEAVVPDDLKYVGIRAHYLVMSAKETIENQLSCRVERVIEDTFSMMILVTSDKEKNTGGEIVWQIDKDLWQKICHNGLPQELSLTMPADKLLLLC